MRNSITNTMRKINFPLVLGSIIVIFIFLMALYPEKFTSRDPIFEEPTKYIQVKENGKLVDKLLMNPMEPNKENIFGTDDAGRDVYSRLVYGTRNTMNLALLVAIFRMVLALPLGIAAGMRSRIAAGIIRIFNTFFTALPMLLCSFIVLNISYFRNMPLDKAIYAFVVVLTFVGWAKLAGVIEDSTRIVMEEDFIEGEIAVGKTQVQIAFQNILPHLIPTSISLFFKEMGMALFLVAQLAVLNVFVGLARQIKELAFRASYEMILEPEWGGALSRITQSMKAYDQVYWMVLFPVLFFTIAIIGLNLTGEGLRYEFQKRNSRVISVMKKIAYFLSPKMLIYQLMNIKKYYKAITVKILIVTILVGYFIIPWHPSLYKFDINEARANLAELTKEKYEGRVAGSEGGYLAGEYILDTLKDYGYEVDTMEIPLIYDYESEDGTIVPSTAYLAPEIIEEGTIKITDEGGKEKIFNLYEDFTLAYINLWGEEVNSENKITLKGIAANKEKAENIPSDARFFYIDENPQEAFMNFGFSNTVILDSRKELMYNVKFSLYENYDRNRTAYDYYTTEIIPFEELKKELDKGYVEMEISVEKPRKPIHPGRNITATLPGKGKTIEDPGELIIIGASYDGAYVPKGRSAYAMTAAPAATALELARVMSQIPQPLEKSIQFIFWDNQYDEGKERSQVDGSGDFTMIRQKQLEMGNTHGYYYIDINYPGYEGDKKLDYISIPGQWAGKENYLAALSLENRLKELKVDYKRYHQMYGATKVVEDMRLNSILTISLGNTATDINTSRDRVKNIDYERMEDLGQIILDTLTMNSHFMKE